MLKIFILFVSVNAMATPAYWLVQDQSAETSLMNSDFDIQPSKFQLVAFNVNGFHQSSLMNHSHVKVISLPLPNGDFEDFLIHNVDIMAPELAIKYPSIQTYRGQSLDKSKSLVLDITQIRI